MSHTPPDSGSNRRIHWNEDWSATVAGLVLLVLVLSGLIPDWLVP
ncbi:hypothetical protein [Nocardia cyriacigeorgica]|nr:hypothetical protein [Nocardia cyriacigeorgica]